MFDLGELRAGVTIDTSRVPAGLGRTKRLLSDFWRSTERDSTQAGQRTAEGHTGGLTRRLPGGLARAGQLLARFYDGAKDQAGRAGDAAGRLMGSGLVTRMRGAVSGAGSHLGGVLASGGKLLAKFAAGGAVALGAVAAAGAALGVSVASSNEQALISFTTMLRKGGDSAAEADKRARSFIRDLQNLAATTPFEFSDLQEYSGSLISAGIEADKIIPIMRNLGDVTAGVGTGSEGIDRATTALQQMIAAGRIQAEDLNQLRDAGIPVYDLLAGATGKSKTEIAKLAQTGKLGKEELKAMLDTLASDAPKGLERFSGLMAKQSQSLQGVLSTLKDNLSQGLAGVMQNSLPLIKQGVNVVSGQAAKLFGYLNDNRDSIDQIFTVAGSVLSSFGRIAAAAFGGFTGSLSDGQGAIESFAGWLNDHQGDMVGFFVSAGSAGITFAKTIAQVASGVLRAYAGLADGVGVSLDFILTNAQAGVSALAAFLDVVPGMEGAAAAAHRAADGIADMREQNNRDDAGAAKARELADALDHTLVPALDGAQAGLERMGATEIDRARQKEKAAEVAAAIARVGTRADGSQLHLRRFADVSKLSAGQQALLRDRLGEAKRGLQDQLGAMADAGAGQKKLTKAWETGRDRLYDEFRQMGMSKREAQKLAEKYAGIPPKVKTNVTQPGMDTAISKSGKLRTSINNIDGRKVKITYSSNAEMFAKSFKLGLTLNSGEHDASGRHGGGVLEGNTPYARGDDRWLPRADGRRQPLRGGEGIYVTEVMRDPHERARLYAANKAALRGEKMSDFRGRWEQGKAAGGVTRSIVASVEQHDLALPKFDTLTNRLARRLGNRLAEGVGKKLDAMMGSGVGAINVDNPRGRTTYKGKTFTNLFAANLRRAEKIAGAGMSIYQGGFRPATSYSGTSHAGDAIDIGVSYALGRALRKVGVASGDRTGLGNWAPHIHAVPTKGAGYAAGSAVWQAQDYLRRGGPRQSMRSPWGLHTGSNAAPAGFGWTAEKGAEVVVNPQLRRYSGGEKVLNHTDTKRILTGGRQAPLVGGDVVLQASGDPTRDVGTVMFALRRLQAGSGV